MLCSSLCGVPKKQVKTEVHWQSVGAAIAATSAFTVISGGPGTGKTTTVVKLAGTSSGAGSGARSNPADLPGGADGQGCGKADRIHQQVRLSAFPSDVQNRLPLKATTLHRLLGSRPDSRRFVHNSQNPLHVDLLVVDEASMIDLEMMAAILAALPSRARLVLLGDKDQLASVEAGSVLGDICAHAEQAGYLPATLVWLKKNTGYA